MLNTRRYQNQDSYWLLTIITNTLLLARLQKRKIWLQHWKISFKKRHHNNDSGFGNKNIYFFGEINKPERCICQWYKAHQKLNLSGLEERNNLHQHRKGLLYDSGPGQERPDRFHEQCLGKQFLGGDVTVMLPKKRRGNKTH